MKKIVIAIDGFSGCGKSTTAKAVAAKLGYAYIDSGAMYRSVTLYFEEHHVDLYNHEEVSKALENIHISFSFNASTGKNETLLNGVNVENKIREMHIAEKVSEVSTIKDVRHAMVAQQRKLAGQKGVVMDGRDIGTTVFPNAELKVFMTAEIGARALRRQKELMEKGQIVSLEEISQNLQQRDFIDSTRKESPLTQAADAHVIDTTHITFNEQVEVILNLAAEKLVEVHKGV